MKASKISPSEYSSFYQPYMDQLDDNEPLIEALTNGAISINQFFNSIDPNKLEFRYAKEKWTPKEILLHLIDAERAFSYRALQFARSDNADLEGFDENIFAKNSQANSRSLDSLLREYNLVRAATLSLFESFSESTLKRAGRANNNNLSVRAAGFLICGHEIHHRIIIEERYVLTP